MICGNPCSSAGASGPAPPPTVRAVRMTLPMNGTSRIASSHRASCSAARKPRGGSQDCLRKCVAGVVAQAPLGLNADDTTACIARRVERSGSAIGTPFGAVVLTPDARAGRFEGRSRRGTAGGNDFLGGPFAFHRADVTGVSRRGGCPPASPCVPARSPARPKCPRSCTGTRTPCRTGCGRRSSVRARWAPGAGPTRSSE